MSAVPLPTGVEHNFGNNAGVKRKSLLPAPMPSGVEHAICGATEFECRLVFSVPMPSGVEHNGGYQVEVTP